MEFPSRGGSHLLSFKRMNGAYQIAEEPFKSRTAKHGASLVTTSIGVKLGRLSFTRTWKEMEKCIAIIKTGF